MKAHTQFKSRGVRSLLGVVLGLALSVATPALAQQSAEVLLQSGMYQEDVKGDLDEAIKVYEGILSKFPENRAVAAKALFHIGLCYEKLGETEARKHYQHLVEEYGDQPALVAQARVRLANLGFGTNGETLVMSTRQVWAPALDNMGKPSPDGRYLSYVNWDKGDLAVRDLETGENRDLTDEGTWGSPMAFSDVSVWSPDSRQIAYLWLSRGDKAEDDWGELRIVGLDGSKPRALLNTEWEGSEPWPTAWSQDGKYILAHMRKSDDHLIGLVSVADGSVRVLKSLGKRSTSYMQFSPDGRYVVFSHNPVEGSGTPDIFLLATDGSSEVALVEHPARDFAPYWAPDGKRIVFMSDRSGSMGLWMLDVDEGKAKGAPKLIKEVDDTFDPKGFTLDGSFYYYVSNLNQNVYVASLDFEAGKVLAPPSKVALRFEGSNYSPAWSPDGKYLAYASRRGGGSTNALVIQSVETGEERDISPESLQMRHAHAYGAPQWSPDGRSILVAGSAKGDRGHRNLYLIDVQTGDYAPIKKNGQSEEPLEAGSGRPVFSVDGKHLYFFRGQSVIAHDLETHEEKELYRSNTIILKISYPSPDGRRLIFVESETLAARWPAVVKAVSTSGGESNDLYAFVNSWLGGLAWTPDGDLILIKRARNSAEKLLIISAEGGDAREFELGFETGQFSLHPDGRRIAFTRGESGADTWVLENFLPETSASS